MTCHCTNQTCECREREEGYARDYAQLVDEVNKIINDLPKPLPQPDMLKRGGVLYS